MTLTGPTPAAPSRSTGSGQSQSVSETSRPISTRRCTVVTQAAPSTMLPARVIAALNAASS